MGRGTNREKHDPSVGTPRAQNPPPRPPPPRHTRETRPPSPLSTPGDTVPPPTGRHCPGSTVNPPRRDPLRDLLMANSALPTQGWGAAPPGKKWLQRQGALWRDVPGPLGEKTAQSCQPGPHNAKGQKHLTGAKGQGQERPFPDTLPKVPPFPGKRGGPSREALALPGILGGRKRGPWRLGRRRNAPLAPSRNVHP